MKFQANEEIRKFCEKKCWGNGRDWEFAPATEGGWIRLWPFKSNKNFKDMSSRDTKMSVKYMVGEVILLNIGLDAVQKRFRISCPNSRFNFEHTM